MSRLASSLGWIAGALVLAQAAQAFAGGPVILRRDLASGPSITLGDLFEGAGPAGSVVVGNGAPAGLNAVLDAGIVERIAHANGLEWANSDGIRRIIVRGLPEAKSAGRSGEGKMVQVLSYTHSLKAGDMVRAEDLTFTDVPSFAAPEDAPRDARDIIGKVARVPLRSGAAASAHDVSNAQVIKRDDTIQVAYHADGITLTLEAKAMNSAAIGDSLSVMNPNSKKVIQAVAVGPDEAVVGPEANDIKSAAYPGSNQFADNR